MPKGPKIPRELNYLKCDYCRRDKQKCMPLARDWLTRKCERCIEKSLPCSQNRKARDRTGRSSQQEPIPQRPVEIGHVYPTDVHNSLSSSVNSSRTLKSPAQCLQVVGDVRHLLDCWETFNSFFPPGSAIRMQQKESKTAEQLEYKLKNALKNMEECAAQLESDNPYEAQYLYQCIAKQPGEHPYHLMSYQSLKSRAGLYAKMLDLATVEDIQERILLDDQVRKNVELLRLETENLIQLYNLFYERILAMDIDAEPRELIITSILYRAVALDCISLYTALELSELLPTVDIFGRTVIHIAAEKNAVKLMQYVLESRRLDIEIRDGFGQTVLIVASKNGFEEMVRLLLERGADVKAVSGIDPGKGKSALHWAAGAGAKDIVRLLLDAGADINYRAFRDFSKSGHNALEEAVNGGHTAVVQLLLEYGADTKNHDSKGRTALNLALEQNNVIAAEQLLANGADISALSDFRGPAPFHRAVEEGLVSMVKLLIRYDIDINAKDNDASKGQTALQCAVAARNVKMINTLLDAGADINARAYRDESGQTALGMAIADGNGAVVKLLLERGADVDQYDHDAFGGGKPIHRAIMSRSREIVELLLEAGANIEARNKDSLTALPPSIEYEEQKMAQLMLEKEVDSILLVPYGRTPLHNAALQGSEDIVRLLLERGADTRTQDWYGRTPLLDAVAECNEGVVQLPLEHGADTRPQTEYGRTPLYLAAYLGNKDIIRLLLESGADTGIQDEYGRTPLHEAATKDKKGVVQLLLEHGADAGTQDKDGRTPLHFAASRGIIDVVQLLVEHGADTKARDKRGKTPLDYAVNKQIILMLKAVAEAKCST